MKKWLAACVAGSIMGFFAIGMVFPYFGFESYIQIEAPLEETFLAYADPGLADQWMSGVVSQKKIAGSSGEAGSKRLLEYHTGVVVETIVEWHQNRSVVIETEHKEMLLRTSIAFLPRQGGSAIIVSNEGWGKSAFWRSALWIYAPRLARRQAEDFGRLRELIESQ